MACVHNTFQFNPTLTYLLDHLVYSFLDALSMIHLLGVGLHQMFGSFCHHYPYLASIPTYHGLGM